MSVCFVVVPIVVGSWPAISAAILAAGATMGYQTVKRLEEHENNFFNQDNSLFLDGTMTQSSTQDAAPYAVTRSVQLRMDNSEVLADSLMRGESFTMQRGDISATFSIDGRGACNVHMSGTTTSDSVLEEAGRELMDRVRQQFAYAKVMQEMEERGFQVVQQEVEENQSIRIRVQRM